MRSAKRGRHQAEGGEGGDVGLAALWGANRGQGKAQYPLVLFLPLCPPQTRLRGGIVSLPSTHSAKLMPSHHLFAVSLIIQVTLLCTCSSMNPGLLRTDNLNDALKPQWSFTQCLVCIY